jgi:hypothetical protein
MSLIPDFTPLINEIKQFNLTQTLILQELKEIKGHLQNALVNHRNAINHSQKG